MKKDAIHNMRDTKMASRLMGIQTKVDIHPDLAKEREDCPFDQEEITNVLDGGKEKTEQRRQFEDFVLEKIQVYIFNTIFVLYQRNGLMWRKVVSK